MIISETGVVFLQGFLDALSLLTKETNNETTTAVVIDISRQSIEKSLINFYDFLNPSNIVNSNNVSISVLQKDIIDNFFCKAILDNIVKERKEYINFKLADYIEYCFENFEEVDFNNLNIVKYEFKHNATSSRCYIFPTDSNEALMISIWN